VRNLQGNASATSSSGQPRFCKSTLRSGSARTDHAGCTCWTERVYADPFAGMSREQAQSVRAQQQARDARGRFYA
jgi:hypothetical protein